MLYPIQIDKPLKDFYGSKISFKIPSDIVRLKSVNLIMNNIIKLDNAAQREAYDGDILSVSLLLNNESDEVISDALFQTGFYLINEITFLERMNYTKRNYINTRIIVNKDIVKNSINYIIFKLSQDIINYYEAESYLNFDDFLRNEMNLTLYLESTE